MTIIPYLIKCALQCSLNFSRHKGGSCLSMVRILKIACDIEIACSCLMALVFQSERKLYVSTFQTNEESKGIFCSRSC